MATKQPYDTSHQTYYSINPFERLPIYGTDVIQQFATLSLSTKPLSQLLQFFKTKPHPYGVASIMYKKLISTNMSQSVIIMGHSGSGKVQYTYTIRL